MKQIVNIIFGLLCLTTSVLGQDKSVFTEQQMLEMVREFHPVATQADLFIEKGESKVRKAKGGFDPYLQGNLDQKQFDGKEYYGLLNGGLKVPTWYGIEVKAGYDQNDGVFLNPENNVPQAGLWYAGISVPVGQGLVIDKRRAVLKQAKLYANSTEAERQKMLNDLYFDAIKQYWYWMAAWNKYQIFEEAVSLSQTRFEGVRQSFVFGDKPAIDTLEAFIQVQNRQMNRNQALLDYQNQTLALSNYLWFQKNTPLIITDNLIPPKLEDAVNSEIINPDTLQQWITQLQNNHPEMRLYDYKRADAEIDRRMKSEALKPVLNLNYNALTEPINDDVFSEYSTNNYKWGVDFKFPVFLRKQRGDLQLTKLKIQTIELNQQQKLLELQNKLRSYYNAHINLNGQVILYTDAVNNYSRLLDGEKQKFDSGESSLFLVNSRETKLIEAQLKLVELSSKYNIATRGMDWAVGGL